MLVNQSETVGFDTHETAVHVAAVPVLIGYVQVSKAGGAQVLD